MDHLIPYLVFPGTCREAMEFYRDALSGRLTEMQTFGDSPIDVPAELRHRIFNSELRAGGFRFKASDDLPGHDVVMGSNVSLFATFSDAQARERAFGNLSEGGKVLFPLKDGFGMLKDRFGVQWMMAHESGNTPGD